MVIIYHLNKPLFPIGWIGVNLFFVISGFLITQILLDQKSSPSYFPRFYFRRVLRILPIYFLLLFVIFILKQPDLKEFAPYIVYLQTLPLSIAWSGSLGELNHTWSLAVEEQFYFIWPFLIYIFPFKSLKKLIILLIFISIVSRILIFNYLHLPNLIYISLPTALEAFALGALLTIIKSKKISSVPLFVSLLFFILFLFYYHPLTYQNVGFLNYFPNLFFISLVNLICFFILQIVILKPPAFLNNSLLVFIGKISYGIYLYHWPIYLLVDRYYYHSVFLKIVVTLIVATTSWYLIEKPILSLKNRYFTT